MNSSIVDKLLSEKPAFQQDAVGNPEAWPLEEPVLRLITEHLDGSSASLETGAGWSTVTFASTGSKHTTIVPSASEVEGIKRYCSENGIATDQIDFHVEGSQRVLPGLEPTELDLVLIDGSHAFPSPQIDWFYTAFRLKVGGILIVDDTHLWTGNVLKQFLRAEPEWRLRDDVPGKSAVFVKESEVDENKNWDKQPYVLRRSRPLQLARRAGGALRLARQGDFAGIVERLRGERGLTHSSETAQRQRD